MMNMIKQLRQAKKLTLRELADKANVAPSYIWALENDSENKKNPSKEKMEKIATALESTVPKVFY